MEKKSTRSREHSNIKEKMLTFPQRYSYPQLFVTFKYKNVAIYSSSLEIWSVFPDASAHIYNGQLEFTVHVYLWRMVSHDSAVE